MTVKKKVILDVDTGSDDAIAIACALLSRECDVLGITTVAGNLPLENVVDNTLRVVQCCGRSDVGVYVGASAPLVSTLMPWTLQAKELKRDEGIRDVTLDFHPAALPLPAPVITPQNECANVWLVNTLLSAEDRSITVIAVGPTTNIAMALKADPRITNKIEKIVIMGGTHNVTDPFMAVEYNVWCDPEALEIILQSGAEILMVPFDATQYAALTYEQAAKIRSIGTAPAVLIADEIVQRLNASRAGLPEGEKGFATGEALHDALAMCAALHPEVLKDVRHVSCHVDLGRGYCYGETVIDKNYTFGVQVQKNCHFAYGADTDLFFDWIVSTLQAAK